MHQAHIFIQKKEAIREGRFKHGCDARDVLQGGILHPEGVIIGSNNMDTSSIKLNPCYGDKYLEIYLPEPTYPMDESISVEVTPTPQDIGRL